MTTSIHVGGACPRVRLTVLSLVAYFLISKLRSSESSAILPAHLLLKEGGGNNLPSSSDDDGEGPDSALISGFIAATNYHRSSRGRGSLTRLRPSPSDDLPILPLKNLNDKFLPTDADTDPVALADMLGADFDPEFSSVSRPLENIRQPNGTYVYELATETAGASNRLPQGLKSTIKLLPFSMPGFNERKVGSSKNRLVQIKNKSRRRQFESYLAAYSSCPVKYRWKDLGERFWPRWIREGHCGGGGSAAGGKNKKRSCSIPAGMTCKPQQSAMKTVLWWHCKRKTAGQRNQCMWISIKYPVIVLCKCSC